MTSIELHREHVHRIIKTQSYIIQVQESNYIPTKASAEPGALLERVILSYVTLDPIVYCNSSL